MKLLIKELREFFGPTGLFWSKALPTATLCGLLVGIIAAFIWKLIYHPEPLLLVIIELIFVTALVALSIYGLWHK